MTQTADVRIVPSTTVDPMLTKEQVMEITALPLSSLYLKVKEGTFPEPFVISERRRGWRQSQVVAWLDALPTVSEFEEVQ